MNNTLARKLRKIRRDFSATTGEPFSHFYCPVLYADDNVQLCKAHIVNQAFEASSRAWTVQRADVDSFYGSVFESDFVDIQYKGRWRPDQCMANKELARRYQPKITLKGTSVEYYPAGKGVGPEHTAALIETSFGEIRIGLKLHPQEVAEGTTGDWQITVEKDLRIAAVVSVLKAAHLTMFELLGYRYGLSRGGYFVGRTVLGEFFIQNCGKTKAEALGNAADHFGHFVRMVRPVLSHSPTLAGTISDKHLYLCQTSEGHLWSSIVFVRTSQLVHAVVIPIVEHPAAVNRFLEFLSEETGTVEGRFAEFRNGTFLVSDKQVRLPWPPAHLL